MPDVMDEYKHLEALDDNALFLRQIELKAPAPDLGNGLKDFSKLPDEALQELLAIARVLRRRTTAPTAKGTSSKKAPAPSLDAL